MEKYYQKIKEFAIYESDFAGILSERTFLAETWRGTAGSTRFQIHVKKSTKYPMRNIFASVPKPRFLPPKITTSTRSTVFISACQFPKLIPIFAEIALLIILHGSVPISTNSSNDNANPIPIIISGHLPKVPFKVIRIAFDFSVTMIGFSFGGKIGAMTVIMILALGPVIQWLGDIMKKHFPALTGEG